MIPVPADRTAGSNTKAKRDKWQKKLNGLEQPWDGDLCDWMVRHNLHPTTNDRSHGTIGGGNHFAELQRVERVHQEEAFNALGLDKSCLILLVHKRFP